MNIRKNASATMKKLRFIGGILYRKFRTGLSTILGRMLSLEKFLSPFLLQQHGRAYERAPACRGKRDICLALIVVHVPSGPTAVIITR